ncbi:MAG: type II toxin-antitoxin system YafQ family toxin [Methylococcales bacterium]
MAKSIFWSKKFKQDYSRLIKSGNSVAVNELLTVIEILANEEVLPSKYQDHVLKGNWNGYRECHIKPDVLLIYKFENDELTLTLVRTGSHSDLF